MQWPPDPSPAPAKTVAYAYDQYGAGGDRHDTTTIGAAVTDSAYDRAGPSAPTTDLRYGYDPFGRLTSVQAVRLDGAAAALTTTYAYDAADRLTATTRPNGTTEARTYDDLNRLKSITTALTNNPGQILAGFTYTLDAAGRRTRVVENTGRQVDYTYDALGRLTGEAVTGDPAGDRTLTYTYDLASNRVTRHDSTASQMQQDTAYGYDDNDRMTSVSSGYNWSQRGYDANGALTSVSGTESATYAYDLEGRMIHANAGGHSIDYAYDDAGRRTSQTVDGQTTTYLNDPSPAYDQVLEEYAPGMMRAATYVRGLDLLFQDRQGARSYYVVDGLGSTRALADQNGAVTDTYTYDAYGTAIVHTGSTANTFQFAGQQRDAATGLDYLRARYYDAATGRFTSRDSYEGRTSSPITLNHYAYAGADPVDNIDPSGHDFTLPSLNVTIAIGAGLGGVIGSADAALGGGGFKEIGIGFLTGAATGAAFAAAAWHFPAFFASAGFQYAGGFLTLLGLADSIQNEHYAQALFRGVTGFGLLNKIPKIASAIEALDVAKAFRSLFGAGLPGKTNFAYADIEVAGQAGRKLAVSGYRKELNQALSSISEFFAPSIERGQKSFFTFDVPGTPGARPKIRANDSEVKLLNSIAEMVGWNRNAAGRVRLVTERTTCDSCIDVIAQFREQFPNIILEVIGGPRIPR